jgi:hypothetical protein
MSHYNFFWEFCGILYIFRTGVSWRDLRSKYGNWHTIYTRLYLNISVKKTRMNARSDTVFKIGQERPVVSKAPPCW